MHTARDSASHLLDLLNDILDISKMESGRLAIVPPPLDLHRLLRDVQALMALSAEAKDLALRVHVAPELPAWVMADGKRLKQILFNLMSNAVKFTDEGEVSLTVTTRPAPADALGAEPMHELRFVVRDSGIGYERGHARPAVPALQPGRRQHLAALRRNRPGAGDLTQPGAHDGWRHHRRQQARSGFGPSPSAWTCRAPGPTAAAMRWTARPC